MLYLNEKNNYKELKSFYPKYYDDVYEMQEILKTNASILDELQIHIENVLDNNFILWADSETISKIEKRLKISADLSKTLDERKKFILSFLSSQDKTSASTIKEMIKRYTKGAVNIELKPFDEFGNQKLFIVIEKIFGEENVNYKDLKRIIQASLPAHLAFNINIEIKTPKTELKAFGLNKTVTILTARMFHEHTIKGFNWLKFNVVSKISILTKTKTN